MNTEFIIIKPVKGGYVAEFHGGDEKDMVEAFGTNQIPLPWTEEAPIDFVVKEIQARNLDSFVRAYR